MIKLMQRFGARFLVLGGAKASTMGQEGLVEEDGAIAFYP